MRALPVPAPGGARRRIAADLPMPAPLALSCRSPRWPWRLGGAGLGLIAALAPLEICAATPTPAADARPLPAAAAGAAAGAAATFPAAPPVPAAPEAPSRRALPAPSAGRAAAPPAAPAPPTLSAGSPAAAGSPSPQPAGELADWPSLDQLLSLPGWLTLNLGVSAAPIANPIGGLTPAANWMQQIELNASAGRGLQRDPAQWRELDHWQAHLRLELYSGSTTFASTIGTLIAPQNMAYPPGLWLSGASLSRSNRSGSFSVAAGLRSLDPDFLAAPVYSSYLFAAFNDTLNINIVGLPIAPFAAPALSLRWRSGGLGEWRLGAWWLGGQAETASLFGVDSGLPPLRGHLQILQWSIEPRLGGIDSTGALLRRDGRQVARQLPPPLLQLGGLRSSTTSPTGPTPALELGGLGLNHLVYGSLTLPARLPLGLDNRLWSAAKLDLDPSRDGTPLFLAGGWLCQGLFPDRPLDVLALGVAGTVFSRQLLPELSNQIAVELNYSFRLNNSLSLQPVLQWIVRPSGSSEQAPILTTALQVLLNF